MSMSKICLSIHDHDHDHGPQTHALELIIVGKSLVLEPRTVDSPELINGYYHRMTSTYPPPQGPMIAIERLLAS